MGKISSQLRRVLGEADKSELGGLASKYRQTISGFQLVRLDSMDDLVNALRDAGRDREASEIEDAHKQMGMGMSRLSNLLSKI